jgi:hypothetical protein
MMKYRKLQHYKYQLVEPEYFQDVRLPEGNPIWTTFLTLNKKGMVVRSGYAWDGPSGPTIDTPTFMRASLCHDALYQLMREGYLPRSYRKWADETMRRHLIEDGMSPVRAWYVYWSLRFFGGFAVKPRPVEEILEI